MPPYTYDEVGNRQTGPTPDIIYAYSEANRLDGKTGASYQYDDYGNLSAKTDSMGSYTYGHDSENRLAKVIRKYGITTETITFKYDPFGRRIEKSAQTSKGTSTTPARVWRYLYDGERVLDVYSGGWYPIRYVHGFFSLDDVLAIATNPNGSYTDNQYYVKDALGSVQTKTGSDASIHQSIAYDSFGVPDDLSISGYAYTGREYDMETGLYYYRARYYDPTVGRFISRDPIGFKGGINLYNYVGSNPVNYTDPSGLTPGKGNVPPLPSPPSPPSSPGTNDVEYPFKPPSADCKCSKPVFHQDVYWNCVYNNVFNDHLDDYLLAAGAMLVPSGVTNVAGAVGAIGLSNYIGYVCRQKATYCY